jgi:hypothetical protein
MTPRGLLLSAALLAAALPAAAQTAVQSAAPAEPAAAAKKYTDNVQVWTLSGDTAGIAINARVVDRYYTGALRLGWTSAPDQVPEALRGMGATLWGSGEARISVDLVSQIYNPLDTKSGNPPLYDHPFAGVLMANFGLIQDTPTTRSTLVLGLGVLGPAALGQGLQSTAHALVGQDQVRGWGTQITNQPIVQLTSERTWRAKLGSIGAIETDALPVLTASVGTLRNYIQSGVALRLGQGLESDFGVPGTRPSRAGGDYFRRLQDFAWYVYAGADGRWVMTDQTVQGNIFGGSRGVTAQRWVADMYGGVAFLVGGMRFTYMHRFTTQTFTGQNGGLHQMGSLSLSMRF